VWHYLHDPMFSRFDTLQECDRQTDKNHARVIFHAYAEMSLMGRLFLVLYAGSHCQHNHPQQISVNRFRDLGVLIPQNLGISMGLAGRSYNVTTDVLHSDDKNSAMILATSCGY